MKKQCEFAKQRPHYICSKDKARCHLPWGGGSCYKIDKEHQTSEAKPSRTNDWLKRLVIAMLQEVQDKELCDCVNDEHLNLDHHVHPTLTVGEIRAAAKELGITEF